MDVIAIVGLICSHYISLHSFWDALMHLSMLVSSDLSSELAPEVGKMRLTQLVNILSVSRVV